MHRLLELCEIQSATGEIGPEGAFTHAAMAVEAGAIFPVRLALRGVALRLALRRRDTVSERNDRYHK
jgi:hypothetical protein